MILNFIKNIMEQKLNNYLLIIMLLKFIYFKSNAQNAVNNMQKYVYYKQRFLNNFIAVGNGMGESLPLDIRRLKKIQQQLDKRFMNSESEMPL